MCSSYKVHYKHDLFTHFISIVRPKVKGGEKNCCAHDRTSAEIHMKSSLIDTANNKGERQESLENFKYL